MKVGDLVRLMTEHYLHAGSPQCVANGQLAIIVEHNEAVCNPWKVKVIRNDREIWLKSHELDLL